MKEEVAEVVKGKTLVTNKQTITNLIEVCDEIAEFPLREYTGDFNPISLEINWDGWSIKVYSNDLNRVFRASRLNNNWLVIPSS